MPTADNEVALEIDGPGALVGTDNGDPASHADYRANRRKAFNGLCLAIVRSNGQVGKMLIGAISPGLQSAQAVIASKA